MIHDLKTSPAPFAAVCAGKKTFEYRKDDRGFCPGDVLLLREHTERGYTGNEVRVLVTYMLVGGAYGIPEGYCIMSVVLERER